MDRWAYEHGVELDFSRPDKLIDNAVKLELILILLTLSVPITSAVRL
jgi:hypothetical protein